MSSGRLYFREDGNKHLETNKAAFDLFCKEARRRLTQLGLNDWEVYFEHVHLDGRYAACSFKRLGRKATISMSTSWGPFAPTAASLKRSALHEVLHLLIADLSCAGASRHATADELEQAEEALVTRLEKALGEL